ncbi:MAG: aromatic ring-hydroxylating dioxygenase subunit alpha, partial [Betaproteobacteria bacterium]
MSELLGARELAPVTTQLPVSWYFDHAIHAREMDAFFKNGPGYVGHELMVPSDFDYRALEMTNGAWALINDGQQINLVSNVCRHRQAVMLKGAGQLRTGNIVCPLHRWTYDGGGKLLGAPHFPQQPCLDLPKKKLQKWNGMLFQGPRDIAGDLGRLGCVKDLDFTGHVLNKVEVTEYNFNWKTFIEVYLEDYHVEPFHPGLGN